MTAEPVGRSPQLPQPWRDARVEERTDLRDPAVQRAIVARIRAGDAAAYELVFRAYRTALVRLAARILSSPDAAGDVVQEVFLKVWRARESWDPGSNLTAYLFAMTRNAALNLARRKVLEARWQERIDDSDSEGDRLSFAQRAPAPDAIAETRDRSAALARAVERLPVSVRETFLLRWRDQLSYSEVATTLGVPVRTVEKRLGRAFASLRRALRPWMSGEP